MSKNKAAPTGKLK